MSQRACESPIQVTRALRGRNQYTADAELRQRQEVVEAARDVYALRDLSETEVEIIVGTERRPYPITIVKSENGWHFDTERGLR